jgi:hypothetical protein
VKLPALRHRPFPSTAVVEFAPPRQLLASQIPAEAVQVIQMSSIGPEQVC